MSPSETDLSRTPDGIRDTTREPRHGVLLGVLIALALAAFASFAWVLQTVQKDTTQVAQGAIAQAHAAGHHGATEIDRKLRRVMALATELASDLQATPLTPQALADRIRATVYADPDLSEMGVAFAPFAFSPSVRLYGVAAAARGEKGVEVFPLDTARDYTDPGNEWYTRPVLEGPIWLEPTRNESGELVATFATAFGRPGGGSGGVVYVTYAVEHLGDYLDTLDLGKDGFACIVTSAGHFISHPDRDLLNGRATMADAPRASGDAPLVFESIPAANWSLGAAVDRNGGRPLALIRRSRIRVALSLAVALICFAALAIRVDRGTKRRLWAMSAAASAVCMVVTGYILLLASPLPDPSQGARELHGTAELGHFLRDQAKSALSRGEPLPVPLETGVMLESINFLSGKDIRVAGYVWQRYEDGAHDGIARGFVIPESDSFDTTERYRARIGNAELIGWSFKAVLHQDFDYAKFPFGEERVRIPIWSKDFHHEVLLVPDLDSYTNVGRNSRFGLRDGMVMPSWDIDETVFSYAPRAYRTRFGFSANETQTSLPALEFDIVGKKQIAGPFVTYLLPIAVVTILTFGVLFLSNRDERRMKLLGFDALKVVTACGGFFLVVIFSQIDLRKTLGSRDIVYLEYFHLTAYAAILCAAVNAIVFAYRDSTGRFRNLDALPALLFWPLVHLGVVTFTLLKFY